MFIALLILALVAVTGAMLTALPRMEVRLTDDLAPRPAEAPTGNS
ncbi:hypothetical protein [Cryptosporangium phraense]|nr:hypothetical protein [Cryptosporangium phraense]